MLVKNRRSKENGTALLEMALIAPFFLFLLISVFDITRCITTHAQIVGIVNEGLRCSANYPYLEPLPWRVTINNFANPALDTYQIKNPNWIAAPIPNPLTPPGPVIILSQLAKITRAKLNELNIKKNGWQIRMEVDYLQNPNQIKIRMKTKYDGFFSLFDNMTVEAQVFGPYQT